MSLPAHPPVELDKYELLDEIGHGGMATVYRARDRRLNREVAIKVIHRHLRESPEVAKRFQSEALAVAKVKHPNIVEVYDVSSDDEEEKYLVVELIRGITLRQLLLEQGALPPEIAACVAVEVCRALAVAHREGVVHRDVKPENVLLSMDQGPDSSAGGGDPARVKLTDFGIAKLLDAQGVTHTGQVLGSPAHMAPEQIEGGDVDARADVFGTGVLLYEMLTGILPFEGKNPAQVLRKVLEGIFLPPERQLPRVGSAYGKIASQALSRVPEDRHASSVELGEALEKELSDLGVKEVRGEIASYLDDPHAYKSRHDEDFPDVIAERAAEARESGEVLRAASLFNRALAYRPDDTQLLGEVAGLARRGRFKRQILSLLVVVSVVGLVGGTLAWWWKERPVQKEVASLPKKKAEAKELKLEPKEEETKKPKGKGPAVADARPKVDKAKKSPKKGPFKPRRPTTQPVARSESTRTVRTPVVVGPQNARVRIDGRSFSWFKTHTLSLGPHTIQFVPDPQNAECCEPSPPETVEIVAGEGDQIVKGVIKFRPATLQFIGAPGSRATCGVAGIINGGSSKTIPMNSPSRPLKCTVFPPPGQKGEPKTVDVVLKAGQTFPLTST